MLAVQPRWISAVQSQSFNTSGGCFAVDNPKPQPDAGARRYCERRVTQHDWRMHGLAASYVKFIYPTRQMGGIRIACPAIP